MVCVNLCATVFCVRNGFSHWLKHCKNCKTAPTGQRKAWMKEKLYWFWFVRFGLVGFAFAFLVDFGRREAAIIWKIISEFKGQWSLQEMWAHLNEDLPEIVGGPFPGRGAGCPGAGCPGAGCPGTGCLGAVGLKPTGTGCPNAGCLWVRHIDLPFHKFDPLFTTWLWLK